MADLTTEHDARQHRYTASVDGVVIGELDYKDTEEGRVFTHSEIAPEEQHHGYGTQMVRAALDDTRGAGIKPIGQCSLVRNFLAEHPDYTRIPAR
jgi:predicted GNAT family acetyltransferase